MENKRLYSVDEVAQIIGCTRQNVAQKLSKINDKALAFKIKKGQRDIWRITQKGLEFLNTGDTEKGFDKVEQETCASVEQVQNNSNSDLIELYKQIIADKDKLIQEMKQEHEKQIESLRAENEKNCLMINEQYNKIYLIMQQVLENQKALPSEPVPDDKNIIVTDEKPVKKWWKFWQK